MTPFGFGSLDSVVDDGPEFAIKTTAIHKMVAPYQKFIIFY